MMAELIENLRGGLGKALTSCVVDGERLLVALEGNTGEALVATDRKVVVIKAGFSSGAMFGKKTKSFHYDSLSSVELSYGLLSGRIQLSSAGTVEQTHGYRQKGLLEAIGDASQAENVVNFPTMKKTAFNEAAEIIREMIRRTKQPPANESRRSDIAAEIRRLAELAKDGLITQEQFETKKLQLLGL